MERELVKAMFVFLLTQSKLYSGTSSLPWILLQDNASKAQVLQDIIPACALAASQMGFLKLEFLKSSLLCL